MKSVQPYLPAILLAIAAIAGMYLLYFKPKQDKAKAAQLAAQAAADAELLSLPMMSLPPNQMITTKNNTFSPKLLAKKMKYVNG